MRIKPIYILLAILAIATLYFYQDPQSNGNSRLAAVRAVVEQGRFQIDSYVKEPGWGTIDKASYNGHYYVDKGIGSSLIALPFYFLLYKLFGLMSDAAIKHSLTSIVMGGAFVISGVVLYRIAALLTPNTWKAMLAALGVSLGTMLWPYSAVYYGHVPAAMWVAISFYLLLRLRVDADRSPKQAFFWAGMAMGFAFITDYTTALIIAGLIVYAVYILHNRGLVRILLAGVEALSGAAIPMALFCAYNLAVYGTPFAFGYSYEAHPQWQAEQVTGFHGIGVPSLTAFYRISLDPRFGLFWQSPVLILAFVGAVIAFRMRSRRAEVLLALSTLFGLMLMNAGLDMWWGGSAFGPRYLIAALPLMVVPLALLPDRLIWLLGSLAVLSIGQMLIPLFGAIQIRIDYDAAKAQFAIFKRPFTGFSILYQYEIPFIMKLHSKDALSWTLGSAIGLPYRYSVALLVGVEAALAGLLFKVSRSSKLATDV